MLDCLIVAQFTANKKSAQRRRGLSRVHPLEYVAYLRVRLAKSHRLPKSDDDDAAAAAPTPDISISTMERASPPKNRKEEQAKESFFCQKWKEMISDYMHPIL